MKQRTARRIPLLVFAAALLLLTAFGAAAEPEAIRAGDAACFGEPEAIRAGDVICFGEPDAASGFDGRWLVLDGAHTSMGTDGLYLLSLGLIGDADGQPLVFREIGDVSVSFSDRGEAYAAAHPGVTAYRDSDIRNRCEAFAKAHLSEAEYAALIPTTQSDEAITIPGFTIPLPGATNGTVDFDPAAHVLDGDRMFLPSVRDLTDPAYGFTDNRSRVALYRGTAGGYWLRSPHIPTFPLDVGFVFPFGAVMDYPVNAQSMYRMSTYARPACNLDRSAITSVERLGAFGEATIWRIGFDGAENTRTYDLTVPEIGEVMDLNRTIRIALGAAVGVVLLLIFLIVWLTVRAVRRVRRRRKSAGRN